MILLQIISLLFFAVLIPVGLGAGLAAYVDKQEKNVFFMWTAGFLAYMALFQLEAVPVILLQQQLTARGYGAFGFLSFVFGISCVVLALAGLFFWYRKVGRKPRLKAVKAANEKGTVILFIIFALLLLIQLFLAAFLAFSDGDDAYYVAVSTVTEASDTMYMVLPYTGGTTGLDTRHCLAPFPLLLAFWARVSGIHAAAICQVAAPLLLIPMTYVIYGLIGQRLFKGKKYLLGAFLIFVSVLILWSNYSLYTAETFLITRTRQGKAALGNIVIPAVFLLLYMAGERLAENKKVEKSIWILLAMAVTASCLCSTMGGFLLGVLLGLFWLCAVFVYKKWKLMLPLLLCLVPAFCYIGLYIVLQ